MHNLLVSLVGHAAGDRVLFDEQAGGAAALFTRFDERVIHGIQGLRDPFTADHAMISMRGQGIGAETMGRRKLGLQPGPWPKDG
ncbi:MULTISPECIES: hypothetical protein [Glutamicibacter]|uniref:Uncharacterized protein n=2 Tax=Glutamicibacter TaxID=1742989 RepID=A0ABV9MKI8_9MICC|nr:MULTISPECIES: hypothetical protein [Glutamicibacter]GGJ62234.1 hypothetical protein GCM10007173_21390 [Glutamicibacter ardleyensis]